MFLNLYGLQDLVSCCNCSAPLGRRDWQNKSCCCCCCKTCKIFPFHKKFNKINIYFPYNVFQTVNVVSTCDWYNINSLKQIIRKSEDNCIANRSFKICLHCSNIYKLWEDIPNLVVFSIILTRPGTILSVVREITRLKKI